MRMRSGREIHLFKKGKKRERETEEDAQGTKENEIGERKRRHLHKVIEIGETQTERGHVN